MDLVLLPGALNAKFFTTRNTIALLDLVPKGHQKNYIHLSLSIEWAYLE